MTLEITDEYMNEMRGQAKDYSFVLLKKTPEFGVDAWPTVWEDGRRNFWLRAQGTLAIVCPHRRRQPSCRLLRRRRQPR